MVAASCGSNKHLLRSPSLPTTAVLRPRGYHSVLLLLRPSLLSPAPAGRAPGGVLLASPPRPVQHVGRRGVIAITKRSRAPPRPSPPPPPSGRSSRTRTRSSTDTDTDTDTTSKGAVTLLFEGWQQQLQPPPASPPRGEAPQPSKGKVGGRGRQKEDKDEQAGHHQQQRSRPGATSGSVGGARNAPTTATTKQPPISVSPSPPPTSSSRQRATVGRCAAAAAAPSPPALARLQQTTAGTAADPRATTVEAIVARAASALGLGKDSTTLDQLSRVTRTLESNWFRTAADLLHLSCEGAPLV